MTKLKGCYLWWNNLKQHFSLEVHTKRMCFFIFENLIMPHRHQDSKIFLYFTILGDWLHAFVAKFSLLFNPKPWKKSLLSLFQSSPFLQVYCLLFQSFSRIKFRQKLIKKFRKRLMLRSITNTLICHWLKIFQT